MATRLYTMNRLPAEADTAVAWVVAQVKTARLTQAETRAGLNERLSAIGIGPVSQSSFNRWFNAGLRDGFPDRGAPAVSAIQQSSACCPSCGAPLSVSLRASDQP